VKTFLGKLLSRIALELGPLWAQQSRHLSGGRKPETIEKRGSGRSLMMTSNRTYGS
jgi:hypothetical protein